MLTLRESKEEELGELLNKSRIDSLIKRFDLRTLPFNVIETVQQKYMKKLYWEGELSCNLDRTVLVFLNWMEDVMVVSEEIKQ